MVDNNFEKEIETRNQLRKKIAAREKLTQDERTWLHTHKEFSQILGVPYLKSDVIYIEKDTPYQFRVSFLEAAHPLMIAPCFKAPVLEGAFTTESELYNSNWKKSKSKDIKMLVTLIHTGKKDFNFTYSSSLGALCVSFFCEYYDSKQHLRIQRGSDSWEGLYMLRTDIKKNEIEYRCRSDGATAFDSLVFLVEWNKL